MEKCNTYIRTAIVGSTQYFVDNTYLLSDAIRYINTDIIKKHVLNERFY